jgi:hypothetical protein
MEVTERKGAVGTKLCWDELVIPRGRKGDNGGPDKSSLEESQDGPVELTGLLARGLNIARRSGERGLLSCRTIGGAIIGDIGRGPFASPRGEGTAAWRRTEGARCRCANWGDGSAVKGRMGLSAGDGLYWGRSYAGSAAVSI